MTPEQEDDHRALAQALRERNDARAERDALRRERDEARATAIGNAQAVRRAIDERDERIGALRDVLARVRVALGLDYAGDASAVEDPGLPDEAARVLRERDNATANLYAVADEARRLRVALRSIVASRAPDPGAVDNLEDAEILNQLRRDLDDADSTAAVLHEVGALVDATDAPPGLLAARVEWLIARGDGASDVGRVAELLHGARLPEGLTLAEAVAVLIDRGAR